jgi:hypothetical protein
LREVAMIQILTHFEKQGCKAQLTGILTRRYCLHITKNEISLENSVEVVIQHSDSILQHGRTNKMSLRLGFDSLGLFFHDVIQHSNSILQHGRTNKMGLILVWSLRFTLFCSSMIFLFFTMVHLPYSSDHLCRRKE